MKVFFVLRMLVTVVMSMSFNLSLVEGKVPPSCSEDAYIHHVIGECRSKEVNGSHVHLTSKLLSRASFCLPSCRKLRSLKICQVTGTNDVVTTASVATTHTGATSLKEMTPADTITTTDEANTTPTEATQTGTKEIKSNRKPTTADETRLVTTETDTTRMESTKADTTETMTTATKKSQVTTGATTELTTETTTIMTTTVAEATALSTTPLTTVSTTPVVTTTPMETTRKQDTTKEVETTTSTSTSVSPTTESPQPELLIPSCDLESWNDALSHCDQLPEMGRRLIVPFNITFIKHIIDLVNDTCGTHGYIWLDCKRNVQNGAMICRDPDTSGHYDHNAWVKIFDLYGESPDWRNSAHLNGQGCLAVKKEGGTEKFFSNSCDGISATTVCMLPS